MGLVFESHDETLMLTGIPVAFVRPTDIEPGALIVDFMIVSNPNRLLVCSEYKMKIPLPAGWYKKLSERKIETNDRVIINLVRSTAENEVDRTLFEMLSQTGNSLYEIRDARVQSKPVLIEG